MPGGLPVASIAAYLSPIIAGSTALSVLRYTQVSRCLPVVSYFSSVGVSWIFTALQFSAVLPCAEGKTGVSEGLEVRSVSEYGLGAQHS